MQRLPPEKKLGGLRWRGTSAAFDAAATQGQAAQDSLDLRHPFPIVLFKTLRLISHS